MVAAAFNPAVGFRIVKGAFEKGLISNLEAIEYLTKLVGSEKAEYYFFNYVCGHQH